MTINLQLPESPTLEPRIVVFGVGGAGGNAVNNMIESNLQGVDFVAANTDAQSLEFSKAERKIQLGEALTKGLGAGARPEVGRQAAEETIGEITDILSGCHMAFITAGMGGGTGSGGAPVIARVAREHGILTVGVVTKPFHFEGSRRMAVAEESMEELQKYVDTLIIIPNQNLFRVANEKTTFADAFIMADNVLHCGVRGVTDLITMPGLINLDFADIRTVMSEMGKAMMGTGEAEGENRATEAAELAISNPLLDNASMKGAHGVLINITGGSDMTLFEVDEAANRIRDEVDADANIIFGSAFNGDLDGRIRVSVVATGIDAEVIKQLKENNETLHRISSEASKPASSYAYQNPAATESEQEEETEETASEEENITSYFSNNQPQATAEPEIEEEAEETTSAPTGHYSSPHFSYSSTSPSTGSEKPSFYMPKAIEPTASSEYFNTTRPAAPQAAGQEEQAEQRGNPQNGLFGRVARTFTSHAQEEQQQQEENYEEESDSSNEAPAEQQQEQPSDLLEIPAFLRRKQTT